MLHGVTVAISAMDKNTQGTADRIHLGTQNEHPSQQVVFGCWQLIQAFGWEIIDVANSLDLLGS